MDEEARKWSWSYRTADGIIFKGPGWIKKVIVCPKDTKKTGVDFHDGIDTSGPIKFHVQCATSNTEDIDFPLPCKCDRGLFVNVDGDTYGYSVQYREEK